MGTIQQAKKLEKMKKIETIEQWEKNPMDDKIDKKFGIKEDSPRDEKADRRNTKIFNANRGKTNKQIMKILIKKNTPKKGK